MSEKPKKSLGQHWLEDKQILESICDIAEVQPEDTILEVGPGRGSLTRVLLEKGANVTAVELDKSLAATLASKVQSWKHNLGVVNQDILSFDLRDLPAGYKVVANIPYYLTSKLIRTLSEASNPPASVTLLVQKEVAERICAKPGAMSVLSVSAQIYYDCELGLVVPAGKFTPPPKVDSRVVYMARKAEPSVDSKDKKLFFRVLKAGFAGRRKTLQNSLSGGLHLSKKTITDVLKGQGIDPRARPQELSVSQWTGLAKSLTR